MRRKRMPERVGSSPFWDIQFAGDPVQLPPQVSCRDVVPVVDARARMPAPRFGGKQILPDKFTFSSRIFLRQRIWKNSFTISFFQIGLMQPSHLIDMELKFRDDPIRQHGNAIFSAFTIPDGYLLIAKIDILYSKPERFRYSQACAVNQLQHQLVNSV